MVSDVTLPLARVDIAHEGRAADHVLFVRRFVVPPLGGMSTIHVRSARAVFIATTRNIVTVGHGETLCSCGPFSGKVTVVPSSSRAAGLARRAIDD